MRRAIQLLVLVLFIVSVRACGVNNAYDRLRAAGRWTMEMIGL